MPKLTQNITITRVSINADALLTPEARYPGGHLCNIFPAQSDLLERAAQELGIEIKYGSANNAAHEGVVGVYITRFEPDPARLLERFEVLKIEQWKQNGGTHETQQPAGARPQIPAHPKRARTVANQPAHVPRRAHRTRPRGTRLA